VHELRTALHELRTALHELRAGPLAHLWLALCGSAREVLNGDIDM